jgi:hypothetical protein
MIDPSDIELIAMHRAGGLAGEYLDSLKTTDLASFSKDEWETLIQTVCGGYVMSLIELRMDADAAMRKVEAMP